MMTLAEIVDTVYRQVQSSLVLVNQLRSEVRAENVPATLSAMLQKEILGLSIYSLAVK